MSRKFENVAQQLEVTLVNRADANVDLCIKKTIQLLKKTYGSAESDYLLYDFLRSDLYPCDDVLTELAAVGKEMGVSRGCLSFIDTDMNDLHEFTMLVGVLANNNNNPECLSAENKEWYYELIGDGAAAHA